ncbi:tRNA (adenosine(37)-N6)-threonylcarbamoyltransferase complex ATPase subunit type 1 TsaE [Terrimonas sp. NA20]|uniref:tRNA threonylcarbamoyladenosine biosynthesis protein TsaE n=1 Tax=Terrimonas ginsenosidimutans TaxID=2908004 RepID=A0ABS9KQI8_9BACT|nr:tRNA (adenosine(37)-N6)-threonylcarbamoyltransferase complex ATPase subunit type 1 TsaE [Terrimonas ginsenosidimutans]MCG2614564.1 tRNA (adenosine(37)-N6)-threonylcarbamoyltransferase complex ATPase subunit type 1 TsaE [Terrimonas ginsenosidimutans]
MEFIYSLETIAEIATQFWKSFDGVGVFALHGEMGAGKTTLVHALCEAKKVKDVVGSPTFSIINEYAFETAGTGTGKIFHIDLYRLRDEEEAIRAGVEDCLYSDHISLVEWPERAPGIFPENTVHVYISVVDSVTRRMRIVDLSAVR